jgi:hypothetical protein
VTRAEIQAAAEERFARRLAARKMRLTDPSGERLPPELWQQCLPEARIAWGVVEWAIERLCACHGKQ